MVKITARCRRWFVRSFQRAAAQRAEVVYNRERVGLREARVGRVMIYGALCFIEDVVTALSLLEGAYPHGYSIVQRYIRAIVQSDTDPENGVPIGVVYSRTGENDRIKAPQNWFAAVLVRRAVATRKLIAFNVWRSPRSAVNTLTKELHAMRLLGVEQKYLQQQTRKLLKMERLVRQRAL